LQKSLRWHQRCCRRPLPPPCCCILHLLFLFFCCDFQAGVCFDNLFFGIIKQLSCRSPLFYICRKPAWRKEDHLAWCSILQHLRSDLVAMHTRIEKPQYGITARRKGLKDKEPRTWSLGERERRLQAFARGKEVRAPACSCETLIK
jgi:hypothetical protein